MDVVVRDPYSLEVLAVLPAHPEAGYLTATLNERWARPDSVTLEMSARVAADAGVRRGVLLIVDGRVCYVDRTPTVQTDERGRVSALATVTAVDPPTLRHEISPPAGLSHDVQLDVPGETAMKHYVSRVRGPAAPAAQRWEPLVIEPDAGRGEKGSWRARYQQLADYLELIGLQTGVGYQTIWVDETPTFVTVPGEVRRRRLSVDEGTVVAEEVAGFPQLARVVVGGQGEGVNRQIEVVWRGAAEPRGLARESEFRDARDTDSVETLRSRGRATLAESSEPDAVEVQVAEADGWRYRDHFGLGDQLEYVNHFGSDQTVRVVEVTSVWRESLVPVRTVSCGRPWPDIAELTAGGSSFE